MNQEENLIWRHANSFDSLDDEKYPIRNVYEQPAEFDSECEKISAWSDEDDEQRVRQELIQRATARLRRRLLEQGLQDVMSQVVSLQTQLETLRLDAATTIDTISGLFDDEKTVEGSQKMSRQMDVLERRLETHKSNLFQIVPVMEHQQPQEEEKISNETSHPCALTMSRLSSLSLVSSIFGRNSIASRSSRATSVSDQCFIKERHLEEDMSQLDDDDCISHIENITGVVNTHRGEEEDHPFYDLAGKRSFQEGSFCGSVYHDNKQEQQKQQQSPAPNGNMAEIRWRRRQRRQRHQQHLESQQQQYYSTDCGESVISDNVSSYSSLSSLSSTSSRYLKETCHHPLSPVSPHYLAENLFEKHLKKEPMYDLTQSWFNSANVDDCIEQRAWSSHIMQMANMYPDRNVLDEAMSFLDGLSENGDDGGFGDDMYLLLQNPELCCKPLEEIQSTMHELRQQDHQQKRHIPKQASLKEYLINMVNPAAWYQMGTGMMYKTTCSSLQWCRFLSVLTAAVIISLLKGPEDIRRHSL